MTEFYVYIYENPDTKTPFYVGKGTKERMRCHFSAAKKSSANSNRFIAYLRKLITDGKDIVPYKFKDGLTEEAAIELEEELISKFGRVGYDEGGVLLNVKLRGKAWRHTDETKAIMSEHANKRLHDGSMKTWSKTISAERRKEMVTKANRTRRVPIQQYRLDGTFVATWPGHVEICESFEFNPAHLSKSLKYPLLPCGGFLWRRSKLVEALQITPAQIDENNRYRLRGNSKKILQLDAAGNSVKIWPSVSEAVREFSCRFAIDKALKTGGPAHGFYWKKA